MSFFCGKKISNADPFLSCCQFRYTMTKSSAVLFILFFSLVFKLEQMRPGLILVVLLISGGLFMFTFKSTQFNTGGFVLVLAASAFGGVRWTLTQLLMQKAELGLHVATSEQLFCSQDSHQLLALLATLALGGLLAFGLGFSEFLLVSKTSSLTLSIAGIFKELCVLLLATHLLGDELSILNWLGFAVCIAGIALHVALKTTHSRVEEGRGVLTADMELLLRGHEDEEEEET
eukprot:XP_017944809.1 PREDICTED: solute carrier family 35 member C2-like isoform X2 [Xenopus tropicalis]